LSLISKIVKFNFDKPRRKSQSKIIAGFSDKFERAINFSDNLLLLTIEKNPIHNLNIIFLHGGAYVCDSSFLHYDMMEYMANLYSCRVTYIDYPLAPKYTASNCRTFIERAYLKVHELYPDDSICLCGDSAGGGLALALRQMIRDKEILPVPVKTILCSPWLDASLTLSDYSVYEKTDVFLTKSTLIKCGKLYAGDLDIKDTFVSPIYGSLENLGDIFMCASSNELFLPDCKELQLRADKVSGTNILFYEQPGFMHDYVLLSIQKKVQQTYLAIKSFLELDRFVKETV
jgi:acetyl esterase/lipase